MVEGGEVEGGGIDSFYEKQKGGVPPDSRVALG